MQIQKDSKNLQTNDSIFESDLNTEIKHTKKLLKDENSQKKTLTKLSKKNDDSDTITALDYQEI